MMEELLWGVREDLRIMKIGSVFRILRKDLMEQMTTKGKLWKYDLGQQIRVEQSIRVDCSNVDGNTRNMPGQKLI